MDPIGLMRQPSEWREAPHEHCVCGSRLVDQIASDSEPVCIDCGALSNGCSCDTDACEFCGKVPD